MRPFLLLLCLLATPLWAESNTPLPLPEYQGDVTDLSAALSKPQRQALAARLIAFRQRQGSQIAVLLLPGTRPQTAFNFAQRVAFHWQLGPQGHDAGVLLVIATVEGQDAIVVGNELQGKLSDAACRHILHDLMRPALQAHDFNKAVAIGVDALEQAIGPQPLPPKPAPKHRPGGVIAAVVSVMAGMGVGMVAWLVLGRGFGTVTATTLALCICLLLGGSIWLALACAGGLGGMFWKRFFLAGAGEGPEYRQDPNEYMQQSRGKATPVNPFDAASVFDMDNSSRSDVDIGGGSDSF